MQDKPEYLAKDKNPFFQSQILDRVDQAILVIRSDGQVVWSNRTAESLCKRTGDGLKDTSVNEIMPAILESLNGNLDQLKQGDPWSGEVLIKRGEGESVWASLKASVIESEGQQLFSLSFSPADKLGAQQLYELNRILLDVDALLSDGTDYEAKLSNVAQRIIPVVADWCCIHLQKDGVSIERVAVEPAEIVSNQAVYEWIQNDLLNDEADGLTAVLSSGKSKLIADVNPIRRASAAGIKSYIIVPLITHQQMLGTITLVAAESGRRFGQNSLLLAENLALHIAAHLEKSQIHDESQKENAELEQRVMERTSELQDAVAQLKQSEEIIQTLFRISNKLNATLDVEAILDTLAQEAIQMVSGESGFAGLRTAEGMTVHRYFQQGVMIPFEHTWALGEGIPGWVMKYKVPYGTSDAANDPLIRKELAINANVRSIICTPILDTVGDVIAYFDIRNKKDAEGFTINDQEMLLTLAPVASIAIQNALAYQQRLATVADLKESAKQLQGLAASLESAREEERTQIARELHDQLGQAMTAMKFDLSWLTEQLGQKDEALVQKTKDITSQMNTLIQTVRRIATELRPGMLEDLGLVATIEWQARDFEKRSGIECRLSLPEGELPLTNEQSLAMFRIFQEALTNVARYAEAKHVDVILATTGDLLTLQMHDDGHGIREGEIHGLHSLGLLGMSERAKYLGGTFEIHGVPGQGTTVIVTIPVAIGDPAARIGEKDDQDPISR